MVRGVKGVTLTWLRTVLWLQGVMESRCYPWCGVTGMTYCPVVAGCDKEQTGPLVRGVTGVTLTWLRTVLWLQGVIKSKLDH